MTMSGMVDMPQPLLERIDCWTLSVPDLEQALAFYREKLGQPLRWQTKTCAAVGFPESAAVLMLRKNSEPQKVGLIVKSATQAAARIIDAGGQVVAGPSDISIGRCVIVKDPWGNVLVLFDSSKSLLDTGTESREARGG